MAEVRGWCPDLFMPMLSGDGWLIRVKPMHSRLTSRQASQVADVARTGGNGLIELTARGNLQLRGFSLRSAETAATTIVSAGLADPDPARERRRNLIVSPLIDAGGQAVAEALGMMLTAAGDLQGLPAKFTVAVSAGPFRLADDQADLMVCEHLWGWRVSLQGNHVEGRVDDVPAIALGLLRDSLAAGGLRHRAPAQAAVPRNVIGWHDDSFGFGLPFGQLDAELLSRLASLAATHGDGLLHLTPWRAMLVAGIGSAAAAILRRDLHDLVLEPDDPRLLVSACIGSAGCSSGHVDARADALALLRLGVRAPSIHVSGCAKGCAHPGAAVLTLVGESGPDDRGRYGLVRNGRAGDTALADGLDCMQLARDLGRSADPS